MREDVGANRWSTVDLEDHAQAHKNLQESLPWCSYVLLPSLNPSRETASPSHVRHKKQNHYIDSRPRATTGSGIQLPL